MNKGYTFDLAYMEDGVKKLDEDWHWTSPIDEGMVRSTFILYLKSTNQLKKMKKFKIIGLENISEV